MHASLLNRTARQIDRLRFWKTRPTRAALPQVPPATPPLAAPQWRCQGYHLLTELVGHHHSLEVRLPGHRPRYQSLLVALDPERDLLWLDELNPAQRLLEEGDWLEISHTNRDRRLSFCAPIVAFGADHGASGLALLLPERVHWQPPAQDKSPNLDYKWTDPAFIIG